VPAAALTATGYQLQQPLFKQINAIDIKDTPRSFAPPQPEKHTMPHEKNRAARKQSLGHQIKAAREKLGLSQSQAAAAWSINVNTLQNWEIGRSEPRGFARVHLDQLLAGILSRR
jgi:DNA-binding transcriptional regulator YiaG